MPFHLDPFETLRSAAKYVRQFRGRIFVLKLGGEVLEDPAVRRAVCEQIALLWSFSIRVVIVHGGGAGLDAACRAFGQPIEKVAGRRVTSPGVLEAAKMVFAGTLHTDLLADLRAAGLPCVGVSGVDAQLITAARRPPVAVVPDGEAFARLVDFGEVGDIQEVNPGLLHHLLAGNYVPVVAPLTGDDEGQVFNTNADAIAAALAVALHAEKLFFLLQVPGLLRDVARPSSLVPLATLEQLDALEGQGAVLGGMRPKLEAARSALHGGVRSVHLVSGVSTDALLTEVFTNEGSGTMLVAQEPVPATVDEVAV
jgi:acetylglutamate kinase